MSLQTQREDEIRESLTGVWPDHVAHFRESMYAELVDGVDLTVQYNWDEAKSEIERLTTRAKNMSGPWQIGGSEALIKAYPLLEHKRWQYLIPDEAWDMAPAFDRLLGYQIPTATHRAAKKGVIFQAEVSRHRERMSSPEGVIIFAGLGALDCLYGHGIEVGHTVGFVQNYLYSKPLTTIGELAGERVAILRAGDIIGSRELGAALRTGAQTYTRSGGIHTVAGRERIDTDYMGDDH